MENLGNSESKFWKTADSILSKGTVIVMGLMCIMVIITVILRYVFNLAWVWSEEAIILSFIFTTYFGSVMCVKDKEHIDIPYFRDKASPKVGFVMDIFVCVFNICVQTGLSYVSIGWIQKTGSSVTAGLKIPYYYIYSIFPLCFMLMMIYTVRRLVEIIKSRKIVLNEGGQ